MYMYMYIYIYISYILYLIDVILCVIQQQPSQPAVFAGLPRSMFFNQGPQDPPSLEARGPLPIPLGLASSAEAAGSPRRSGPPAALFVLGGDVYTASVCLCNVM